MGSPSKTILGDTTNGASVQSPAGHAFCAAGAAGPETAFKVTVPGSGGVFLTAKVSPMAPANFDTVLYARSKCEMESFKLPCDDLPGRSGEVVSLPMPLAPSQNTVFLLVDGSGPGEHGPFDLSLALASGLDCASGAITLPLEPVGGTADVYGIADMNTGDHVSCPGSGLGAGNPDVVYHLLPAGAQKRITLYPMDPNGGTGTLIETTCPVGAQPIRCTSSNGEGVPGDPTKPVIITTTSDYVWVDIAASSMQDPHFRMTVEVL
jgi:hypothetical protein